jgi:hypothetical protein
MDDLAVAVARMAIETPTRTAKTPASFHGFPAAALLFGVADCIGSYHRGNRSFTLAIDRVQRHIDGDGYKHLFILNSAFYGQSLTEKRIRALYTCFRNPLTHNGALVPGVLLNKGEISDHVFYPFQEERDIEVVNVVGLLAIIEQAVEEFLKVAPSIVPNSQQAKINALKAP